MKIKQLIPKKLKILIKERFKQQKIFAEKLQVGETQVTNWLNGNVIPSVETLEKIAYYCNIHITYFFNDESSPIGINEDLFNEVFLLAYDFSLDANIALDGYYFLGCYALVLDEITKNPTLNPLDTFNTLKPIIKRLCKRTK